MGTLVSIGGVWWLGKVCRLGAISSDEGIRLLRIVRRSSGSVVTWRRAQMVLLSVQGMDVAGIAKVTFTSPDRVREVINRVQRGRVRLAVPEVRGRPAPDVHAAAAPGDQKTALSRRADHGLPFSTWSLSKLAEVLVAEGWSTTSATWACGSCSAMKRSRSKP